MNNFVSAWKHPSLYSCCWDNFRWDFRKCMGDLYGGAASNSTFPLTLCDEPPPPLDNRWYVEYYNENEHICVQECQGPLPCYGKRDSYKESYDSFNDCCDEHMWWLVDCRKDWNELYSGLTPLDQSYGEKTVGGELSEEPSGKYFADYQSGSCLRDCDPGPFGCAPAPPPVALYDDIHSCCSLGLSWVFPGYCMSRSFGSYTNGWFPDYATEKCAKDCDPSTGAPCKDHSVFSTTIYNSPEECCETFGWVDGVTCVSRSLMS